MRTDRGALLRTESESLGSSREYRLQSVERLDADPPALIVWVDVRETAAERFRDVFREVHVTTRRRLSLEPSFFLWPLNVARTPVGLVGAAASGFVCGTHYVAAGVGAVCGIVGGLALWPFINAGHELVGLGRAGSQGLSLAGTLTQIFTAVLETPLLLVDVPHRLAYGTSIYPVFTGDRAFPGAWVEAMARCWGFAWGWHAYAPFVVWTRPIEERAPVPDGELAGPWEHRETAGDWELAPVDAFRVEAGGATVPLAAGGHMARVDLRELALRAGAAERLEFTVSADTPQGALTGTFSYRLADLGPAGAGALTPAP